MLKKLFGSKKALKTSVPLDVVSELLKKSGRKIRRKGNIIRMSCCYDETIIEAKPMHMETIDGEVVSDIVTIQTKLPVLFKFMKNEQIALLNTLATTSALIKDPASKDVFIGSRLSAYTDDEDSWRLFTPLMGITAILQAELLAQQLQQGVGAEFQSLELFRSSDPSRWNKTDFEYAATPMTQRGLFCNADANGLSVEFPWELEAFSVITGSETCLLTLQSDMPHPHLGTGLFSKLSLPLSMERDNLFSMANKLNLFEFNAVDAPPFFGAWCVDFDNNLLAHIGFWPNLMYHPGTALNIATWMLVRSRIVRSAIENKQI